MAIKKLYLHQGLGNYNDKLDLLEYINQVLNVNGYPVNSSCCITTNLPTNGQTIVYDSVTKKWIPTSIAIGGLTNLGYTASALNGIITNNNGTTATIPLVTTTNAGLATPAMATALSASTPTTAQIGVGNTYVSVVDPATGAINFVVDGITQMTISQGKITTSSFFDPSAVGFTKMTLAQASTITGALYNDSIYIDSVTNHLHRGSIDLETLGGAGTITSVFGRSTAAIVATNGDYTASQVTNVPSGNISAVTVQAALTELDTEKANNIITGFTSGAGAIVATDTVLQAINKLDGNIVANDAAYVHKTGAETISGIKTFSAQPVGITATSIVNVPSGNVAATTVQAAITELDTEKIGLTSLLTGLSLASTADVVATDTVIGAFGKIQAQLDLTSSTALTSGNIFVGNASNIATGVTMSGDVTITNLGATTVLSASDTVAGKVELATIAETETGTSTTLAVTPADTEATYIKKSIIAAKGDLIVGTADNTSVVLTAGTNSQVLVADSTQVTGLKWVNSKYSNTFITTDWVVAGTEFTISIPQTTHLRGLYPQVTVQEINGALYRDVSTVIDTAANGDVTLTITAPTFNGRYIIS